MNEKHTPGPWERLEGFAEPGHPVYKPGQYVIRIVQKRQSAQMKFVRLALVDSDNPAADARLIAAAPDLLAALTLAEDVLSRFPFSSEIWPNGTHPNTGIEQIRAAIAKATGDQCS